MSRRQAPGERSAVRKAVIAAALPLALLAAVVVQLSVVNRLPLPGGDRPDLVLLLVTAVAVRATPLTGTLTGFAGGLALDVAPPPTHAAGAYALVFCLAGYGAARAAAVARDGAGDRSMMISLVIMAAAAAAGEAGKAVLGLLLADPSVTGPAIRHVLPGSVLGDLLLSPVAAALAAAVAGRPAAEYARRPERVPAGRLAVVFRPASAGAAPGLRLAGRGPVHQRPSWARREPRRRLSGVRARPAGGTYRAGSPGARPLLAGGRAARLHFSSPAGSGWYRRPASYGASYGAFYGGGGASPAAAVRNRTRSPSRGWLHRDRRRWPAPVRRRTPSRGWLRASRRSPGGLNWSARPAPGPRRRRRPPWRRRRPGRLSPRGAAAYASRPYPGRRRRYSRRLLAIVGVRR